VVNPFTSVSRTEHNKVLGRLATASDELADSQREVTALRIELQREIENAERLTDLMNRALASVQILREALVERQIGARKDPALVLVANLPEGPKKHHGFTRLNKRRRMAAKRDEAERVRRNALPTLTAQLPEIPLTTEDMKLILSTE
jgi:hypothetical protein